MEFTTHTTADVTILDLTGRLDAYTAPAVAAWLTAAMTNLARIVVNLASVQFVDSTGMATLVQGMKHCRQHNGDLRLCALQPPVRMIFELTRLDKAFVIAATEAAAVETFGTPEGGVPLAFGRS